MASDVQQIEVGQVWRRKKDGALVRITLEHTWRYGSTDDWSWLSVDGKRKGRSYGMNIRRNYDIQPTPTLEPGERRTQP